MSKTNPSPSMPNSNSPITSILFVCWGNICRSPAAENVMRQLLEKANRPQILCDSAGTLDAHAGSSPDPRMSAAGKRRGLPMTGRTRGVRREDFEKFDLILAMDHANKSDLQSIAPNSTAMEKVQLFCEYCRNHEDSEVPDPYYGGPQGFEHVLDLLEDGCSGLLEKILDSEKK